MKEKNSHSWCYTSLTIRPSIAGISKHDRKIMKLARGARRDNLINMFFRYPSDSTLICMKLFNVCANKNQLNSNFRFLAFTVCWSNISTWPSAGSGKQTLRRKMLKSLIARWFFPLITGCLTWVSFKKGVKKICNARANLKTYIMYQYTTEGIASLQFLYFRHLILVASYFDEI